MDSKYVNNWIDTYVTAWRSSGTSMLSELFTENVSYTVSPWKPPIKGLHALKSFWENARSSPDETFKLTSEIIVVKNNKAVIKVEVTYHEDKEKWRDLWLVTFSEAGLCTEFEEWPFKAEQDDGQKI